MNAFEMHTLPYVLNTVTYLLYNQILDARISILLSVLCHVQGPPWILKQVELESSG